MRWTVWILVGVWMSVAWAAPRQSAQQTPTLRAVRKVSVEPSASRSGTEPSRQQKIRVRCGMLRVVSRPEDGRWDPQIVWRAHKAEFSVRRILDVLFVMALPESRVPGDRVLHFVVRTPRGSVYQKIDAPMGAPEKMPGMRTLSGYRHPLREYRTRLVHGPIGRMVVTAVPFPVGGTAIQQNGLYGTWRVEAHMEGARRPCAVATFVLRP